MKAYLHGECCIRKIEKLPDDLNQIKSKKAHYVIAPSETSGNDHCIENISGIEMYEKDGILYMKNEVPAKLFCIDQSRHDTEIVPPGIWEINRANEYDYLKEMKIKVAD